jgi:dTMP kinase
MRRSHHFPGYLIVIEGIDGAGKSTLADLVQNLLMSKAFCVIRSREPTNGQWGQMLRDSALTGRLSLEEEVETFIKDRKEHVEKLIIPALRGGKVVLLDRYYFSTMAYQGARGVDPNELMRRNETFAPEPDLLALLDVEPKLGLERIRTRGDRANHFETTGTLDRAREIFNRIQKPYLLRLDGTQPPQVSLDLIFLRFLAMDAERAVAKQTYWEI